MDDYRNDVTGSGQAGDLTSLSYAYGVIEAPGDVDVFQVLLLAGLTYTFDVRATFGDATEAGVDLRDGDGGLVTSGAFRPDPNWPRTELTVTAAATGVYYLTVAAPGAGTGSYSVNRTGGEATEGDDVITGSAGGDSINGRGGADVIDGGAGGDGLEGGAGDDVLYGGEGDDRLSDDGGSNVLHGAAGDDTLVVTGYPDEASRAAPGLGTLYGGDGNDEFHVSGSVESDLYGEAGDDWFTLSTQDYSDDATFLTRASVYGGDSEDTVSFVFFEAYSISVGLIDLNLGLVSFDGGAWADQKIDSIEHVAGAPGGEIIGGTGGANRIDGDGRNDVGGDDLIYGRGGDDTLDGGVEGFDTIYGGLGADYLYGGGDGNYPGPVPNPDLLYGGEGADLIVGGSGDDMLSGDSGDDMLYGGRNGEKVEADVVIQEDDYPDLVVSADTLSGGSGADLAYGGWGDDLLRGGAGADTLEGAGGDDVFDGGTESDVYYGGTGSDTLLYDLLPTNVTVNLGAGTASLPGTSSGAESFSGIENVRTGSGADVLTGGAADNALYAGAGADVLAGDAGADVLEGGAGADVLAGGAGRDSLFGGAGDDLLDGGTELDLISGGAGVDTVQSSGAQPVRINLASGRLSFPGTVQGFETVTGVENASGGSGGDFLTGGAGTNLLRGRNGDDVLTGGAGADVLVGGAGNDRFEFLTLADSAPGAADRIEAGDGGSAFLRPGAGWGDVIDLSALDADGSLAGDQAFVFGAALGIGRLWVVESGGNTHVRANADADADFEVEIVVADAGVRATAWSAGDFVL